MSKGLLAILILFFFFHSVTSLTAPSNESEQPGSGDGPVVQSHSDFDFPGMGMGDWGIMGLGMDPAGALGPAANNSCDAASITKRLNVISHATQNFNFDVDVSFEQVLSPLEGLINHAQECGISLNSIQADDGEQIQAMARRIGKKCVDTLRGRISNELKYGDVTLTVTTLNYCATKVEGVSGELNDEMNYYLKENRKKLDLRRERCEEANVDTSKMGPPRQQGDIGWCYANAAADLVSFKLGTRISAIDLAMNYNYINMGYLDQFMGVSELGIEKGSELAAIEDSMTKGFCRDEDLKGDLDGEKSTLSYYRGIVQMKNYLSLLDMPNSSRDLSKKIEASCASVVKEISIDTPGIDLNAFFNILLHVPKKDLLSSIRALACKDRIKPAAPFVLKTMYLGAERKVKKIDELLNQTPPLPMVITYLSGAIGTADNGLHGNTIIGRRFNSSSGVCEYRIRNTWGKDWNNDGTMWVSEKNLTEHLVGITYLK